MLHRHRSLAAVLAIVALLGFLLWKGKDWISTPEEREKAARYHARMEREAQYREWPAQLRGPREKRWTIIYPDGDPWAAAVPVSSPAQKTAGKECLAIVERLAQWDPAEGVPGDFLEGALELGDWHRRHPETVGHSLWDPVLFGEFLDDDRQRLLLEIVPVESPYWDAVWRLCVELDGLREGGLYTVALEAFQDRPEGMETEVLRRWRYSGATGEQELRLSLYDPLRKIALGDSWALLGLDQEESYGVLEPDLEAFDGYLEFLNRNATAEANGVRWWTTDPELPTAKNEWWDYELSLRVLYHYQRRAYLAALDEVYAGRRKVEDLPEWRELGRTLLEMPSFSNRYLVQAFDR